LAQPFGDFEWSQGRPCYPNMGSIHPIVSLESPDFHGETAFWAAATWCLKVAQGVGSDLLGAVRWAIFPAFEC
jgi:hypothetical protein